MIAPASDIANKSFLLYGVKDTGFEVLKRPTITSEDEVIVEIKKTGYVVAPLTTKWSDFLIRALGPDTESVARMSITFVTVGLE